MVEIISSLQNKVVKDTARLTEKKYRQQSGLFLLEGPKLVHEILDSSWIVEDVFIDKQLVIPTEMYAQLKQKSKHIYQVTSEIIAKISDVQTSQGIVATAHMQRQQLEAQVFDKHTSIILLENIQDPGNIGTIIRTAVATGIKMIILSATCADTYSPKVVRASMGGVLRIPIVTTESATAFEYLHQNGFSIFVTSLTNASSLYDATLTGKVAIVLGNEANGVSNYALEQSSNKLFIPQIGKIESLNVSIAGGVIMYEILRQKLHSGLCK